MPFVFFPVGATENPKPDFAETEVRTENPEVRTVRTRNAYIKSGGRALTVLPPCSCCKDNAEIAGIQIRINTF